MRGDRGAASTEVAVLVPVFLGFVLLVVFSGRVAQAEGDVAHAAQEAARAASLRGHVPAAVEAAQATAADNLVRSGMACRRMEVAVDTSAFRPGGQVGVTVTCVASLSDLALLAVPGERSFSASAWEVIDVYRAEGGTP